MNKITADSIQAHIDKSSVAQTSLKDISETAVTPSRTESSEPRRSHRPRARSSRAKEGGYDERLAANKQRAARAGRTRARNKKVGSNTGLMSAASETDSEGRDPSRPPTPIATANQPEAQTMRGNLQDKITQKFYQAIDNVDTQTLMEIDVAISADPAYTSQSEEQDPETRFLSPVVVGAGGGFHLDHPTHRPGSSRTYRESKGGPRTIAAPGSPAPNESTELENHSNPPHIQPFPNSQGEIPSLPLDPVRDLNSPFIAAGSGLFLGYPDDQGTRHSSASVSLDKNPAPPQQLSAHSQTPSLTRELRSDGTSNVNRPLSHQRSLTHITTSSKSMGNPIKTPPPTSQSQAKRPLETPATSQPARKRPTTTRATPGGKAYTGRLNIVEINSERVSASFDRSREVSRQTTTSRPKGKSTTRARTLTRTRVTHSQGTGNDHFDLLDGPDEGQLLVESAAKGELLENPEYHKPTSLDLVGYERAIWKDVLEAVWAFSMREGNFQTRATFASWASACFTKLVELKLPNLDPDTTVMSDDMMTVILNNLPNAWYQDYLRVREYVRDYYELSNPATPDECQATKTEVAKIYPDSFHYRSYKKIRVDPYEGYILFIAFKAMFFYGPKAIGAKYPALFERSTEPKDRLKYLAVLAYVATMVQFCLSEWSEGFFNKGTLNATTEHSVWLCHFDGLKNVDLVAHDRFTETYDEWVQNAYDASQAQIKFTKKRYVQTVVLPKDVRPDTASPSPAPHGNK